MPCKCGGLPAQVRMLRGASASSGSSREKDSLKAHLAGVLGLLLRHATEVNEGLASTGELGVQVPQDLIINDTKHSCVA